MTIERWLTAATLAACLAGVAPADATGVTQRIKEFDALLAEQWQHQLQEDPESATVLGDLRYNDRWRDLSLAHARAEHEATEGFLKRFEAVDTQGFPPDEQLNQELMVRQLRESLRHFDLKLYEMPLDPYRGEQLQLPNLIGSLPFDNVKEYEDYLARLKAIPAVLEQTEALATQGRRDGMMPPRFLLEKIVPQIDDIERPSGLDNAFAAPLKHFPDAVPAADRERLSKAITVAIDSEVRPAYRKLSDFVAKDYAPYGRTEPGVWQLSKGDEIYRFAVEQMTTTKDDPAHLHAVGLAEVKRIEAQMLVIAKARGYTDLASFRAALKRDPKLHATSRDDILRRYRGFIAQMQPELPKLFGLLPKTQLNVVPVEAYREKNFQIATYQQGTPDGSRPGQLYVNTGDFAHRSITAMESVAYHEGIPGHHLQLSIAQSLQGLPPFRQQADYTAYIEGWALYAERLGKDIGFYEDPLSDYGRLSGELWRSDRLVLDTGVHYKHWTREQMVEFFRAHSDEEDSTIQNEIDRYIIWPGQALAYKVGQLKMLELRDRARSALGDRFDIRAFHDEILGAGALPLDVLDARIDAWIKARSEGAS